MRGRTGTVIAMAILTLILAACGSASPFPPPQQASTPARSASSTSSVPTSASSPPQTAAPQGSSVATRCFTLTKQERCGQYTLTQAVSLPLTYGQAAGECAAGFLVSPIGCAVANGRVPLNTSRGDAPAGHYWAWFATGDVFACPIAGPPLQSEHCAFAFHAHGSDWSAAKVFSAPALKQAAACPSPLTGAVVGTRIRITVRITGPSGSATFPALVDTGGSAGYMGAGQLEKLGYHPTAGSAYNASGYVGAPQGTTGYVFAIQSPEVLDGSRWVPMSAGGVKIDGIAGYSQTGFQAMGGIGLGPEDYGNTVISTDAGHWTIRFPCGGQAS